MGTRPKPTEHLATSESETSDRREVAESVCDDPILHTDTTSGLQQQQQTEYSQIYPEQQLQQQRIESIPISQSLALQQSVHEPSPAVPVPEMTSVTIQTIHEDFPYLSIPIITSTSHIPIATSSPLPGSSSIVPKIRIASDLYIRHPSPSVSHLDQPGTSGLQQQKGKSSSTTSTGKKHRSKTVTCDICQKNFLNLTKLQNHIKTVHSDITQEETSSSESSSTQFLCEHCNKNFSSKFKLVRHVLIHSDRRQFSCTVCERTFHRKDHLKNHIKVHSPTKKIYICDRENCKKEYTSALSYKKHLAIHFAEEGHLDCKICSKKFDTKQDILYHLKIHAGSRTIKNPNEKKFRCDYCERKFFTSKDVRRHLVVHTGRRDFLCQFCPQRFGRKDHLVRHIKKSHSSEDVLIKREIEIDPLKIDQPYELLSTPSTSGSTSSYFRDDVTVLKSGEVVPVVSQQYVGSASSLMSPATASSQYGTIESIKLEPIKVEPTYELLRTVTPDTSSTTSTYFPVDTKRESDESTVTSQEQHQYVSATLMPSTSYSTEQHLLATEFNIETDNTFIQHSDANIFAETAENLFQSATFANLNPILTSTGDILLSEQHSLELAQQTSTEVLLEHEYEDILQTENPVLQNPDILGFISETDLMMSSNDEDSKPLPGFSQAFQNQPPPKE